MRGPTPAANGVNFPFPQNRHSANCNYPNYRNADVKAAYEKWKADTVTADGAGGFLRVRRSNEPGLEPNSTVSEGIAYGMLIAVYMADQSLFDGLWKYEQLWLDDNKLMHWYISGNGKDILGKGAASDADEDMAWALLMADRQWGGKGSLGDTYLNIAKKQIEQVYNTEIQDDKLLKPGDSWGGWSTVNPSYFAPSYYRAFAKATGNDKWIQVLETSYETLAKSLNASNKNLDNGLVPAWCTSEGAPNAGVFTERRPHSLPVRFVPHALSHRPRLLSKQRAPRAELRGQDQSIFCGHRRQANRRRLQFGRQPPSAIRKAGNRQPSSGRRQSAPWPARVSHPSCRTAMTAWPR